MDFFLEQTTTDVDQENVSKKIMTPLEIEEITHEFQGDGIRSDLPQDSDTPILDSNHFFFSIVKVFYYIVSSFIIGDFLRLIIMVYGRLRVHSHFTDWNTYNVWKQVFDYNCLLAFVNFVCDIVQFVTFRYILTKQKEVRRKEMKLFLNLILVIFLLFLVKYVVIFVYGGSLAYLINRLFNNSYEMSYIFTPSYSISENLFKGFFELCFWVGWLLGTLRLWERLGINKLVYE